MIGGEVWTNICGLFRQIARALPYLAVAVFDVFRLVARLTDREVKALVLQMRLDPNLAGLLGGLASIVVTFLGVNAAVLIENETNRRPQKKLLLNAGARREKPKFVSTEQPFGA